jgi:hypothetical protein
MGTKAIPTDNRQRFDVLVSDPEAPDVVRRSVERAKHRAAGLGLDVVAVAVMAAHGKRRREFLAATLAGLGVDSESASAAAALFIDGVSPPRGVRYLDDEPKGVPR